MTTLNLKIEAGIISDYDKFGKYLSTKYETPITVFKMCDSCQVEIPRNGESDGETIFQCRNCHLNYDLCDKCQVKLDSLRINGKVECPDGFGCNNNNTGDPDNTANIQLLYIKNKPDVYSFKEKQYRKVNRDIFTLDNTKIEQIITNYNSMKFEFVSLLGNTDRIDHNIILDLWIYYRSIDPDCVSKYGRPNKPIDFLDYHTSTLFRQLEINKTFELFLSKNNTCLCFIYSNGDEFVIEKLSETNSKKYGVPFVSYLLSFSEKGLFSRYPTDVINDIKIEHGIENGIENGNDKGDYIYVITGE